MAQPDGEPHPATDRSVTEHDLARFEAVISWGTELTARGEHLMATVKEMDPAMAARALSVWREEWQRYESERQQLEEMMADDTQG